MIQKCLRMNQDQCVNLSLRDQIGCNNSLTECSGCGENTVTMDQKRICEGVLLVTRMLYENSLFQFHRFEAFLLNFAIVFKHILYTRLHNAM